MLVKELKLENIKCNEYNPNTVSDEVMLALKLNIERHGFNQPILVRKESEKVYVIVDGEHRYRVMKDLGKETIPSVVLETGDDADKVNKLLTVSMNGLKGRFDLIKLSDLLRELKDVYSENTIKEELAMGESELQEYLVAQETLADDNLDLREESVEEETEVMDAEETGNEKDRSLSFELSLHQVDLVETTFSVLLGAGFDKSQGFLYLVNKYGSEYTKN